MNPLHALQIIVTGRVQGVGFRPFVSRLAHEFGLTGWVLNRSGQVEIHVEGDNAALTIFQNALINRAPPLAILDLPRVQAMTVYGHTEFTILQSVAGSESDAHIPPDYFVCDACLKEMQDPAARRYRYPFINCTQCGPRYTLINKLPYDRPNTSMSEFALCPDCQKEYSDPLDRRYHAQPLACPQCGPSLSFHYSGKPEILGNVAGLNAALACLREGLIVAVKGIGGYHLVCDASAHTTVQRLRARKPRPHQPLAVLVPWRGNDGLEMVRQLADVNPAEQQLLGSPQRPIVLLQKRETPLLSSAIAPGLNEVGLMLPYSPLHHLLAEGYGAPLVITSANISGEPVLTEACEVEKRLGRVAEAFLHHNRPILRPADDSVFRRIANKPRPLRIGRGLAPIERTVALQFKQPILAVGADLKSTIALGFKDRIVVSPHIGNLGTVRSADVFDRVIADLVRLYDIKLERIICDAHPSYHSSRWAKAQHLPLTSVYHHHAHASALVGEHGLTETMLVFTWDGTGYGEDGSIWGGEALLGSPGNWQRVASIRPFKLPGGDKASRELWRCALALCWEEGAEYILNQQDTSLLRRAWEMDINCPPTSSIGRLFDAAAALIGLEQVASYEGHAAMNMEAMSVPDAEAIVMPMANNSAGMLVSDWGPLLPMLQNARLTQAQRCSIFHASLAATINAQALAIRQKYAVNSVGLSGGVFQNRILTEQALTLLQQSGFSVYLHADLPSGDGGISFGQLIEASAHA